MWICKQNLLAIMPIIMWYENSSLRTEEQHKNTHRRWYVSRVIVIKPENFYVFSFYFCFTTHRVPTPIKYHDYVQHRQKCRQIICIFKNASIHLASSTYLSCFSSSPNFEFRQFLPFFNFDHRDVIFSILSRANFELYFNLVVP